jgi:hypothetical protein
MFLPMSRFAFARCLRFGEARWLFAGGLLALGTLLGTVGCGRAEPPVPANAPEGAGGTIEVVFTFDDKRPAIAQEVTVDQPLSVEAVMRKLDEPAIELSGSGTTAFVRSIEGLETVAGRGWLYEVDGQWAERGIGQTTVAPGSEIRWRYGEFASAAPSTAAAAEDSSGD